MRSSLAVALLTVSALVPDLPTPLRAQVVQHAAPPLPLLALALSELNFGQVLQGVRSSVSPRDPVHAGLFEVRGPANATVRVEFILPTSLSSTEVEHPNPQLPVSFGPGDGLAGPGRGAGDPQLPFDPHLPVIRNLSPDGHLYLRMGGTVNPGRPQAGGGYRAVIYMTVYSLGS